MTVLGNGQSHLLMCVCWLFLYSPVLAQTGVFPRLLPPANDFRLTLKEEPESRLPSIASCRGLASKTVPCRVFSVTLENRSGHAVRISGDTCDDPLVSFDVKSPNTSGGWYPASQSRSYPASQSRSTNCFTFTNLRLKPGETTRYVARLLGPRRTYNATSYGGAFPPGTYTLRATWVLWGCTDASDADDCLTPLQKMQVTRATPLGATQPVGVQSNEIAVVSPVLPDLGPLKVSFDVMVHSGPPPKDLPSNMKCKQESSGVDCIVFHAEIRNRGRRALQWFTATCMGPGIGPEYKTTTGEWQPLSVGFANDGVQPGIGVTRDLSYNCTSNVLSSTPILPGEALERDFTLSGLLPPHDTTPLHSPGEHHLRFELYPNFCFASPDGSFCLKAPKERQPVPSQEITISTQ